MTAKTCRLTIDIEKKEHKRLKTLALMLETTMRDLILLSVDEFWHRKPNKVTLKAIKQSLSGKGLKKFNNLDELFDDLGI